MKFKFSLIFFLIIFALILLPNSSSKTKVFAACDPGTGNVIATDLITTRAGSGFSTSSKTCVVSTDAVMNTTNIRYDIFKSLYYTQSKAPKVTIASLPATIADQTVYLVTGDLTVSGTAPSGDTAVVFVDGQLNINSDFIYGTNTTGIVFIVGGNVNISRSVKRVDAVIISSGVIRTAGSSCSTNSVDVGASTNALIINGSLISLESGSIIFCRTLTDNASASEVINLQVKYLVILRNILSNTVQRWTEVLPTP